MQDFPLELVIEVLVAVLLIATVFYCHVLNRRLRTLREGQDGLRELIESLNVATERARNAIAEMKMTSDTSAINLQEQVGKARALTDELSLMVESGNNLAGRIEGNLTGGGGAARVRGTSSPQPAAQPQAVVPNGLAAQELADGPEGGATGMPSPTAAQDPEQARRDLMDALRQTR